MIDGRVLTDEDFDNVAALIEATLECMYEEQDNVTEPKRGNAWIYFKTTLDGIDNCLTSLGVPHSNLHSYQRLKRFKVGDKTYQVKQ